MLYLRLLFCTHVDPEIVLYTQLLKSKQAWSRTLTQKFGKKVVVCGGSSCAYSIMGMRMLQEHGLPTANMGLHAGFGATLLAQAAIGELHAGDTLILAIEPPLLAQPHELSSFACKLGNSAGHPEWVYLPFQASSFPYLGTALRCTTGWKWLMIDPRIRRNSIAENHWDLMTKDASGWQSTSYRPPAYFPAVPYGALCEDNRKFLKWIAQWCATHQVRVAYSLPWGYQEQANALQFQKANRVMMREIASILPVLKDARMGVSTDLHQFGDTAYHLDAEAAAVRTDELARQIKNWEIWAPKELDAWEPSPEG